VKTLTDIAPYAALSAAALALVVLVLVVVLWNGVRRLRRSQTVVLGHHEERDIVAAVDGLDSQVRNLREAVEILTDQLDEHKAHLDHALTNRAIVRYDAFRDAGGEQSASFALLDNYRSGVVLSAIAARDFARIYVKHLRDGVADRDLSPEEAQAVEAAVPRPLKTGEEGHRSLRAPRLADQKRAPDGSPTAGPSADDTAEITAEHNVQGQTPPQATPEPAPEPPDDESFTWLEPHFERDDPDPPHPET
jgi:hypothetical protein